MAGIQMKIDILNVKKCTWLDIWSTCVSRSTPEFRSDLKGGFLLKQDPSWFTLKV